MKFYTPKYEQLDLDLLRSTLDGLDKSNRWVALGDLLPWAELEKEYNSRLDNRRKGAGNKPARMIIGAMIIKYKLNLSDAETIEIIRENPHMQYLCGLKEFTDKPIFNPSLFTYVVNSTSRSVSLKRSASVRKRKQGRMTKNRQLPNRRIRTQHLL